MSKRSNSGHFSICRKLNLKLQNNAKSGRNWSHCSRFHAGGLPADEKTALPGLRPFHQKSTRLTELTILSYVVQIWTSNGRNFELTKPSKSTVWYLGLGDQMVASRDHLRRHLRKSTSVKSKLPLSQHAPKVIFVVHELFHTTARSHVLSTSPQSGTKSPFVGP